MHICIDTISEEQDSKVRQEHQQLALKHVIKQLQGTCNCNK